ncbi:hypothetical protein, partial [Dickeya dianthicola]|uniref:hypothetical protein n=1 Tax=Dickeya dianthicola TaxID=204039 RepID=UPI001F620808
MIRQGLLREDNDASGYRQTTPRSAEGFAVAVTGVSPANRFAKNKARRHLARALSFLCRRSGCGAARSVGYCTRTSKPGKYFFA